MQGFTGYFPSWQNIYMFVSREEGGWVGKRPGSVYTLGRLPLQRKEEQKMQFHPEGHLIDTFENRASLQTPASLAEAMRDGKILEAKALMCDSKHNLIVDLKFMRGIIPREEGAIGIRDGSVRDIAILSRVNRPVCFLVQDFIRDEYGRITALLSRRAAQEKCREEFI